MYLFLQRIRKWVSNNEIPFQSLIISQLPSETRIYPPDLQPNLCLASLPFLWNFSSNFLHLVFSCLHSNLQLITSRYSTTLEYYSNFGNLKKIFSMDYFPLLVLLSGECTPIMIFMFLFNSCLKNEILDL